MLTRKKKTKINVNKLFNKSIAEIDNKRKKTKKKTKTDAREEDFSWVKENNKEHINYYIKFPLNSWKKIISNVDLKNISNKTCYRIQTDLIEKNKDQGNEIKDNKKAIIIEIIDLTKNEFEEKTKEETILGEKQSDNIEKDNNQMVTKEIENMLKGVTNIQNQNIESTLKNKDIILEDIDNLLNMIQRAKKSKILLYKKRKNMVEIVKQIEELKNKVDVLEQNYKKEEQEYNNDFHDYEEIIYKITKEKNKFDLKTKLFNLLSNDINERNLERQMDNDNEGITRNIMDLTNNKIIDIKEIKNEK